jgi:hypothetical protein
MVCIPDNIRPILSFSILGLDRFHVSHPDTVPYPERTRVVNTNGVNAVSFQ